jgi:hypothetical protein
MNAVVNRIFSDATMPAHSGQYEALVRRERAPVGSAGHPHNAGEGPGQRQALEQQGKKFALKNLTYRAPGRRFLKACA